MNFHGRNAGDRREHARSRAYVMTCSPDYLVMGMSAVTFYGGAKGADAFQAKVEKTAGVSISIGSHSCTAALKAYGGVKRIAFLSPYYPVANEQVREVFHRLGLRGRPRHLSASARAGRRSRRCRRSCCVRS